MTTYSLAPGVRWTVGPVTVTLIDPDNRPQTLQYPEAAIWDLLSRGYPFARIVALAAQIASLEAPAADALVRSVLDEWAEAGFVIRGGTA